MAAPRVYVQTVVRCSCLLPRIRLRSIRSLVEARCVAAGRLGDFGFRGFFQCHKRSIAGDVGEVLAAAAVVGSDAPGYWGAFGAEWSELVALAELVSWDGKPAVCFYLRDSCKQLDAPRSSRLSPPSRPRHRDSCRHGQVR